MKFYIIGTILLIVNIIYFLSRKSLRIKQSYVVRLDLKPDLTTYEKAILDIYLNTNTSLYQRINKNVYYEKLSEDIRRHIVVIK